MNASTARKDDDDEGLARALGAIRDAFPALSWESAERDDEGWDHGVVILRGCAGNDARGHRDLVFRFPDDAHERERLPAEIAVLAGLAGRVEAVIPRYTHVPRQPAGALPFAGYPLVRGDRLTPELLRSLPGPECRTLAGQLGALLAALHVRDTSSSPFDLVPASYQPENLDFVRRAVATDLSELLTADELDTARAICHEVAALQARADERPEVLLHNDVHPRHLYWERATAAAPGRLGLIDFTDMCLGDPAVDFAELYAYGPRFVEEVLARYVGRIDGDFLDRAWTYRRLAGLYHLAGHLTYGEDTWERARATFDSCRSPQRPRG